ncbi:hypothetical protein [Sporomusa aerivorans]
MKNKKRVAAIITALLAGYAAYMKAFKGTDIDVSAFINAVNILLGGN